MIELTLEELSTIIDWAKQAQAERHPLLAKIKHERETMYSFTKLTVAEIKEAWDRHHKRRGGQVWQVVFQTILGKIMDIDRNRFITNHLAYCEYQTRKGWSFCTETLMDWIDNGCLPPPPEAAMETNTRTRRIAERRR